MTKSSRRRGSGSDFWSDSDFDSDADPQYLPIRSRKRGDHDERTPTAASYTKLSNRGSQDFQIPHEHARESVSPHRRGEHGVGNVGYPQATNQSGFSNAPASDAYGGLPRYPTTTHPGNPHHPFLVSRDRSSNTSTDSLVEPPGLWRDPLHQSHSPDIIMPPENARDNRQSDYFRDTTLRPPQEDRFEEPRPTVTLRLPLSREASPTRFGHRREDSDFGQGPPSSAFTSPSGTDNEDSSDEYDWSGEEDLAEEASKYVEQFGQKPKNTGWGIKRIFALAFSSIIGSTLTATLVALPAVLVHFYWYKPNPTDHRKYVNQNVQAWLFWVAANIVISWYLAMIIDIIPIVIRYVLAAIWGHVPESFKTRIETYNAVKDSFKPAFYAASLFASWVIIFAHIYKLYNTDDAETSRAPYLDRTYQVVMFFFFFVLILCIQKMLAHYIAFNFHQTAYQDRIEAVEDSLAIIEKLQRFRPRRHYPKSPSGARTPLRFSATIQPQDLHTVNSRLTGSSSRPTFSRLVSAMTIPTVTPSDRGHDGDTETGDNTLVGKPDRTGKIVKPKKIRKPLSWFNRNKTTQETINLQELSPESEADKEKHDRVRIIEPAHSNGAEKIDGLPRSRSPYPSRPSSPTSTYQRHKRGQSEGAERPLVQAAKVIKNAVLHDARNIRGQDQDLSSLTWNVNSTLEAKRLARSLYKRLKDRHRKYLIPADFYPAFRTRAEAEEAFAVLDADHNGDLSRAELKRLLVRTYRERRFLSRALRDAGEALRTLDRILLFFGMIILFFISLSVFGVEVGSSLTSVYSIVIAASFIFKNAASRAFDAIMFLFVTHPYDTGDRVFVDAENLVVKKMGLFATTFARSDGTETYYFNSQLFAKFITNARRSGKTTEMMDMQVQWKTPLSKLDALEKCLNEWLSTEENRWYQPETGVTLQHILYQRYLTLTVGIAHNGNWQDWGLRNTRKTTFHAAVQYYCRQLGIIGYEAPIPIVYGEPALSHSAPTPMNFEGEDQHYKEEIEAEAKNVKPLLGFLPPLAERSSTLARARKSRRNKYGAMNAEC